MSNKVILAGASGLIGGQVARLLADKSDLHLIGRKQIANVGEDVAQHVLAPEKWNEISKAYSFDVGICCLGSTIAKAGSREAFAAIDRDLVLEFAAISKSCGTKHFIIVSSVGASAKSANFYLSVKGSAEDGLRAMGFQRLDILRPGLLRGDRQEQRTGEGIAMLLSPLTDTLMHGPLRRYRSIDSATVARAIANLALGGGEGQFIHENDAMVALAG